MSPRDIIKRTLSMFEKVLPLLCVLFFLLGIWLSRISEYFASFVDKIIGGFVNYYVYVAPFAIYLIVTPAFSKILAERQSNGKGFVRYTMLYFARLRLIACVWACVFTSVVFGLPIFINHTVGLGSAITKTFKSMLWMFTHSAYFYALYASIITVLVSTKFERIRNILGKGSDLVEKIGGLFIPMVPVFMLFIGSYVAHLPVNVRNQIGEGSLGIHLNTINILGLKINSATPMGMILAYLAGAFLTGIACFIWHFGLLILAKIRSREFSIIRHFRDYWIRVYPLLWATSSEALATPLNIYLIQKYYNRVRREVTHFVVGLGSFMNINGTIMCVFILAGLVCSILGIQISLVDLLLSIVVVFLIGYGVPGIPGELLMFGGPLAVLLRISPEAVPVFLALYLGLQIGLPDSFRTGANSTEACAVNIILGKIYEERFLNEVKEESVQGVVIPGLVPIKEDGVYGKGSS